MAKQVRKMVKEVNSMSMLYKVGDGAETEDHYGNEIIAL